MLYAMLVAFGASVLAALWMAKRLAYYDAYKPAFMVVMIATLGWCLPIFLQVFVLAGFITIGVQYWEETKPAFLTWIVAAGATLVMSYAFETGDLRQTLGESDVLDVEKVEQPGTTTP